MGIVVGPQMRIAFNGDNDDIITFLESVLAATNAIYIAQLNIKLQVRHFVILDETGASEMGIPDCSSMDGQLSGIRNGIKPSTQGLWHLFDDCFPGSGVIGKAYVGAICGN